MIDYSFIEKPNLPQKRVSHVVVSPQYAHILRALENEGIKVLTVGECSDVLNPLRNHSDMLFSYLGNGKFAAEKSQLSLCKNLLEMGMNCVSSDISLKKDYPFDTSLNFLILDEKIICSEKNTSHIFKINKKIINVRQGYTKCSCLPVDENSLITDDPSVYKVASSFGFDVLLVNKGSVKLDGFDYGFIGGCGGKISKDIICFCGDVRKHAEFVQINAFLRERNVYTLSLSDGDLIDIGSIIPVCEHN